MKHLEGEYSETPVVTLHPVTLLAGLQALQYLQEDREDGGEEDNC